MVQTSDKTLLQKRSDLVNILEQMRSVIVAYSGGVDSAFLAAVANEALGRKALSVTAVSPSLAPSELDEATDLANRIGLNFMTIETVSYTHLTLPTKA